MMTSDEFLDAVYQIANTNERPGLGIQASTLGNLVVRSLRPHWSELGFPAFKAVLQELERRSQIRLGDNEKKAYTVWSIPSATRSGNTTVEGAQQIAGARDGIGRLKKTLWIAFVNALPQGRRFIHRNTGAVRMGLFDAPNPQSEWIEIQRISDDHQRKWACEFLESNALAANAALREALNDGLWFVTLRERLRHLNPDLLTQWNRFRSAHVKNYVRDWCVSKGIDYTLVAEEERNVRSMGEFHAPASDEVSTDARKTILAALSRMPTQELLQIPIAGKYFFGDNAN